MSYISSSRSRCIRSLSRGAIRAGSRVRSLLQPLAAPWNSLCGACQLCYVQSAAAAATMLLWQADACTTQAAHRQALRYGQLVVAHINHPPPANLGGSATSRYLGREPKTDSKRIVCRKSLTTTERFDIIALRRNRYWLGNPSSILLGGFLFLFRIFAAAPRNLFFVTAPPRLACRSPRARCFLSAEHTAAVCGFTLLQFR